MTGRALSVLVVEDDARLRDILTTHLDRVGYLVRGSGSAEEALQSLATAPADVVLSDVRMPGMDGRALLKVARERHPSIKVVLMTAFGSVDDAVAAMRDGAYTYVCKPFKVDQITAVLGNVAREVALVQEVEGLRRAVREPWSAERLVGRSERMQAVRAAIRGAARVPATVLVTGPSGTGKELAARAIHHEGPRAAAPFIPVNCAAIPEPLFESSLFGHRRGAFTGATESQPGFVERSSGGTLFLDEAGEIPLGVQAKLLRVLQESELTPLGAARAVRVDLRVIAATNRSLEALVRSGAFREDLFYRLDVLRIEMPALADRLEDVPELAEHLLREIAAAHSLPALGFTDAARASLARHRWPGNVRELRNVIERAHLAARGRRVDVEDLGDAVRPSAPGDASAPRVPTLAEVEKAHVERVLALCDWNRTTAARLLKIDCRTLLAKIERYGLIGPMRARPRSDEGAGHR